MMLNRRLLPILLCTISFSSCIDFFSKKPYAYQEPVRWAWKPVYSADDSYTRVTYQNGAAPVKRAGKIYVKGNYIFQTETGEGIHIIDNSNPAQSRRIGFLKVGGSEEIAIKGNYLYTNNYYDLVTIDISQPGEAKVVSRSPNAFYAASGAGNHTWELPPDTGWYQCPTYYIDSVVSGWVKDSVYAYCLNANQ
ncbi:MAG: hypothetical protein KF862_23165 [Chitinophagaceae bacterium]|nr:hypothetical protein [Chitinophagaceae bacterium]